MEENCFIIEIKRAGNFLEMTLLKGVLVAACEKVSLEDPRRDLAYINNLITWYQRFPGLVYRVRIIDEDPQVIQTMYEVTRTLQEIEVQIREIRQDFEDLTMIDMSALDGETLH